MFKRLAVVFVFVFVMVALCTAVFAQGPLPVSGANFVSEKTITVTVMSDTVSIVPKVGYEFILSTDGDHGDPAGLTVSTVLTNAMPYTFTLGPGSRLALRANRPVTLTAVGSVVREHVWVSDVRKVYLLDGVELRECDETHNVHKVDLVGMTYQEYPTCKK